MTDTPDDRAVSHDLARRVVEGAWYHVSAGRPWDYMVEQVAAAMLAQSRTAREDGRRQGATEMREAVRKILQRPIKSWPITQESVQTCQTARILAAHYDEQVAALTLPGPFDKGSGAPAQEETA